MSEGGLLRRLARPRIILLALLVQSIIQATLLGWYLPRIEVATGGLTALDMRFVYGEADVWQLLDALGETGRDDYRRFNELDMVYPLAYATALALIAAWLLARIVPPASRWNRLAAGPIVLALCDYGENAGIFALLRLYPRRSEGIAEFTAIASTAKQAMIGFWLAALAVLIVLAIARGRRRSDVPDLR